jgi:NitT/TauT family transport system substrate-binding protein
VTRSIILRGVAGLLGITVMLAGATRTAQTAAPDEIRVGRATASAFAFATFEVGNDAHIWDKVGLKLDISSFNGDADVQRAMTAGQIDFGLGGGPAMGYHNKGVPGIAVASMYGPPTDMGIIVSNDGGIKKVSDLKGKKLGVTTSGSLTDWLVHAMAQKEGWGPEGIDSVAMGSTQARVSAVEAGQIAGTVQDTGVGYDLEAQGKGRVFRTFGDFVPKFETHVIFATDDMIKNHPDIVTRFLKGWFMTVAYMRTHKAQTVHSIAPVLGEPEAIVGRLYDADMAAMSRNGAWDPEAVAVVAQSLKDLGLSDTVLDAKVMLNSQFVPVKI